MASTVIIYKSTAFCERYNQIFGCVLYKIYKSTRKCAIDDIKTQASTVIIYKSTAFCERYNQIFGFLLIWKSTNLQGIALYRIFRLNLQQIYKELHDRLIETLELTNGIYKSTLLLNLLHQFFVWITSKNIVFPLQ